MNAGQIFCPAFRCQILLHKGTGPGVEKAQILLLTGFLCITSTPSLLKYFSYGHLQYEEVMLNDVHAHN